MADGTDPEDIRERKREELKERLEAESSGTGTGSPDEPVAIDGDLSAFVDRHDAVLVDFYADWCGPCKAMEPVVERIAAETDAAVAKVDVDANGPLAAEYGVRSVPTFVVFRDGEPVERLVGGHDESRLRSVLGV
ncbi:MAG: thioredoxin [Haloferacaceae archaeon]